MAEVFGTVAAALSVAALFNNCVDCFEYVQLGRNFGRDYERCRLKLDIAQTRLSRWGLAVAINEDSRYVTALPADAPMRQLKSILEEIELLFQSVQKTSNRYALTAGPDDLVVGQDGDMQAIFQRLHGRLRETVRQRQKKTSLWKKASWALYDGKNFDRLIEQVTGFVDDLEKIWPVEAVRRQLVQLEVEEVNDEPALAAIQNAATHVDSILAEVAEHKAMVIASRNHAGKVDTQDDARVRVGNEVADNSPGIADQTSNTADTVDARGKSRVHIGTSYGGRGIFDD